MAPEQGSGERQRTECIAEGLKGLPLYKAITAQGLPLYEAIIAHRGPLSAEFMEQEIDSKGCRQSTAEVTARQQL